jgi:prepilin-type processing-associated H-X9-DG protein
MLDYNKTAAQIAKRAAFDRCEEWDANAAFRHNGTTNVLYYDGSIRSLGPTDIDPCGGDSTTGSGENIEDVETDGLDKYTRQWVPYRSQNDPDDDDEGTPGLLAEYRPHPDRSPTDWNSAPPISVRIDKDLNMPFGSGFSNGPTGPEYPNNPFIDDPKQAFTVIWRGEIRMPYSGDYRFWVSHDDFAWITIYGQEVYADTSWNGGPWGWTPSGYVTLPGDQWLDFEVRLHQWAKGGNHIRIQWEGPVPREDIPQSALRIPPNTPLP